MVVLSIACIDVRETFKEAVACSSFSINQMSLTGGYMAIYGQYKV